MKEMNIKRRKQKSVSVDNVILVLEYRKELVKSMKINKWIW